MKTIYALLVILFIAASCENTKKPALDLSTWQKTRDIALEKAKAADYDFIIDHLVSQEMIDAMIEQYGAENWRAEFQSRNLRSLSYYFGWMNNPTVETSGDRVYLVGQHDCHASFINVDGRYLFLDFGQRITSM